MLKSTWRTFAVGCVAATALTGFGPAFAAEDYPSRPVDMIVPWGPGGGADLMARTTAQIAAPSLGVSIPVSNISGGTGNAGLDRVMTDAADGHTLGVLIAITVSSWAAGLGSASPDDFTVVGFMQNSPSMLFVPKNSPFQTVEELFDHAKSNPGQLTVATSGYGSQDDITLRYLAEQGIPMTNVPFAQPAERYASTVGGHTDVIYEEPGDVAPFLASGDLRPLVIFDENRHAAFPDIATSAELGLEISDLPNFRTIVVNADTPPERVETLRRAFDAVLASPEWKAFCTQTYTCVDEPLSPEEAQQTVQNFFNTITGYMEHFPQVAEAAN